MVPNLPHSIVSNVDNRGINHQCPRRKFTAQANLIDEATGTPSKEIESDLEDTLGEETNGHHPEGVDGDVDQFLMIHRVMLAPKASFDDRWLRRSLFRTTCTVGAKLCSVII